LIPRKSKGEELAQLLWSALNLEPKSALCLAHSRWPSKVEHHAALPRLLGAPDLQQLGGGQVQIQPMGTTPQFYPDRVEQASHLNGHLIAKGALPRAGDKEFVAVPLQIQAAVVGGAAAEPQLPLQDLEGQPQLVRPLGVIPYPFPAGALGPSIDQEALGWGAVRWCLP
jgi:hypothetical protein